MSELEEAQKRLEAAVDETNKDVDKARSGLHKAQKKFTKRQLGRRFARGETITWPDTANDS